MTSKEIQECKEVETLQTRLKSPEVRKYERRLLKRKIARLTEKPKRTKRAKAQQS